MGLTITVKGLTHHNLSEEDALLLLGESAGLSAIKESKKQALKAAVNSHLSQFDWYFVREIRTGKAVPENVTTHYSKVLDYTEAQETLIDSLDYDGLTSYQFSVPSFT